MFDGGVDFDLYCANCFHKGFVLFCSCVSYMKDFLTILTAEATNGNV